MLSSTLHTESGRRGGTWSPEGCAQLNTFHSEAKDNQKSLDGVAFEVAHQARVLVGCGVVVGNKRKAVTEPAVIAVSNLSSDEGNDDDIED